MQLFPKTIGTFLVIALISRPGSGLSLSSYSTFCGTRLQPSSTSTVSSSSKNAATTQSYPKAASRRASSIITMRKQKASDRRTRRMQRGGAEMTQDLILDSLKQTITSSPMDLAEWKYKRHGNSQFQATRTGGRQRSRKRQTLYNSLSSYHNKFLQLLTAEYKAEEQEVLNRIKSSIEDPLGLEMKGHALYDIYPERRGNLFSDEVYRLVKARDATLSYAPPKDDEGLSSSSSVPLLPPNHKFSNNDVIMLTLQPQGSGDFYDPRNLPISSDAISVEGRVIATGPTYVDVVLPGGAFESAFGPAPNNEGPSGRGDPKMRLRVDRFFSDVPYTRMVSALTQLTAIPDKKKESSSESGFQKASVDPNDPTPHDNIMMDDVLRETIISTHAFSDPDSILFHDVDACDLQELGRKVAKPPMPESIKLANQALGYIQKNPNIFNSMNRPQLASIGAALTRKLTLIQGPPGSGKTTVASAIGFGFTHQARSVSPHAKVLSCAFSNVGADNLAEGFLKLGLKVIRVGKASAVSEHLWDYTLDAAIDRDPDAQKALQNAARATSQLSKIQARKGKGKRGGESNALSERTAREIATAAVQLSIQACNIAATKALREADIIVSTSTGAADARLMAACGLGAGDDEELKQGQRIGKSKSHTGIGDSKKTVTTQQKQRTEAPDGLPPLSLPFVIVDEACQSVEPATLIPLTASNSCKSLVLLGDPCQLPATVKNDPDSILAISMMERLAATLPPPSINVQGHSSDNDSRYMDALPVKHARSLMQAIEGRGRHEAAYRKRFAGALLLSIQYRMHPSIAAFASAIFYDGSLTTPALLASYRPFPRIFQESMPNEDVEMGVRFIDVGGRCNERRGEQDKAYTGTLFSPNAADIADESTTYQNEAEAEQVVGLIKELLQNQNPNDPFTTKSIGVVTPYNGQVQLIKSMIANDMELRTLLSSNPSTAAAIEVKSVDGYQGRERDVIIFSAVRSNRRGNIGFLRDWRRLNVAMTRARNGLIVVGDLDTLTEGDKHWAAFGKWCQSSHCIVESSHYVECDMED